MVVKKIHQIWVGPKPLPGDSEKFMTTIKELHPEYEYKLWTDADLTAENFSTLPYIKSTKVYAQKADIMRYEILYRHGGIYLDTDFQVIKALDPLLTHDLVVCNEDLNVNKYMSNSFIYSIAGHPSLKKCVDHIKSCKLGGGFFRPVNVQTGPWYFRRCISLVGARILPTKTMFPIHCSKRGKIPSQWDPETFGAHHWYKSW